jgi:hypothetical protein
MFGKIQTFLNFVGTFLKLCWNFFRTFSKNFTKVVWKIIRIKRFLQKKELFRKNRFCKNRFF